MINLEQETRISDALYAEAAECLKVMAHPARLKAVEALCRGPLAVHEIAAALRLPHHQACAHLRLLKSHGLLDSTRRGRFVTYHVADPRLPRLMDCLRAACAGNDTAKERSNARG